MSRLFYRLNMEKLLLMFSAFIAYCCVAYLIMRKANGLKRHPSWIKRWLTLFYSTITLSFLLVIEYTLVQSLIITSVMTYIYSAHICRFKRTQDAPLTVTPYLFNTKKINIHLTDATGSFGRSHYRELRQLLDALERLGIVQITLTSPMFYKGINIRGFNVLESICEHKWALSGKEIEWKTYIFEITMLAITRLYKPTKGLKHLSLTRWYQITLDKK